MSRRLLGHEIRRQEERRSERHDDNELKLAPAGERVQFAFCAFGGEKGALQARHQRVRSPHGLSFEIVDRPIGSERHIRIASRFADQNEALRNAGAGTRLRRKSASVMRPFAPSVARRRW